MGKDITKSNFQPFFKGLFRLFLFLIVWAIFLQEGKTLSFLTFLATSSYFFKYYSDRSQAKIPLISIYTLFGGYWFGIGNYFVFLYSESELASSLFTYGIPENYYKAQLLSTCGALIPCLGYEFHLSKLKNYWDKPILKPVGFRVSVKLNIIFALLFVCLSELLYLSGIKIKSLGILHRFTLIGTILGIYMLQVIILHNSHNKPLKKWLTLTVISLTIYETITQVLFGYMRIGMILPLLAFVFPYILYKKLPIKGFIFLLLLTMVISPAFKTIGAIRIWAAGMERFEILKQQYSKFGFNDEDEFQIAEKLLNEQNGEVSNLIQEIGLFSLLSRGSSLNQLSHIIEIVEEDGYYEGKLLKYWIYMWIPRIIWPNKPTVVPGQWFASKIGIGRWIGNKYSNAINMTIPGEFYLNFGLPGVVVGLWGIGFLYLLLIQVLTQNNLHLNPISQILQGLVAIEAAFNGSDLASIAQLILWYLLCLALTIVLPIFLPNLKIYYYKLNSQGNT